MSYSFRYNKERKGIYDELVDCVYVITMENNVNRHKNIEDQFKKYNLCKNTIIVENKGYKNNDKYLKNRNKNIKVTNSIEDLTHANLTIFQHALDNKFNFILSLGTHAHIYNTTNMKNIINSLNKNTIDIWDWDIVTAINGRIFYNIPLIYQLFPSTENQKNWGFVNKKLSFIGLNFMMTPILESYKILLKIHKLDKIHEPGTSHFYKNHVKI